MHLPAAALPGALGLFQDMAGQAIAGQIFGTRSRSGVPLISWVAPAFLNAWVNFGGGYNDVAYAKGAAGEVRLHGLMKSGVVGSAAFQLPAGFRPAKTVIVGCLSNGATAALEIRATGDVVPTNGSNVYFSLDNISFDPA